MANDMKKTIAKLLVIAQLTLLFPFTNISVYAEEDREELASPILNKTIVGTLTFQSFNLLGSNSADQNEYYDGVDYHTTFYYSDDYFSQSAINEDVGDAEGDQDQTWAAIDNMPLASASAGLALASFTTNEGNCVTRGGKPYNNTDYSDKDKNARSFLAQCGFNTGKSDPNSTFGTAESLLIRILP